MDREFYSSTPIKMLNGYTNSSESSRNRSSRNQNRYQQQDVASHSSSSGSPAAFASNTTVARLQDEIKELQKNLSEMALEYEQLKLEYEVVCAELNQKEIIQTKMREHLEIVNETVSTLSAKLSAFKCRYYEDRSAWLDCAEQK